MSVNPAAVLPRAELWRPDLAQTALTAPSVAPLKIPGITFTPYEIQSRGITWLYATPRSILGDVTGLGKAPHGIGLAALCAAKGELSADRPMIFVTLAATVGQHLDEFKNFWPGARLASVAGLNKARRLAIYGARDWDVLVLSYDLLWRDAADMVAMGMEPWLMWLDESSKVATRTSKMAKGARVLARVSARVHEANATPIENDLMEVHSQLEVLGLAGASETIFGNEWQFRNRYCIYQKEQIRARGGKLITREKLVGYNNLPEFVAKFRPFYLRRTEGSADMPDVAPPEDIWLEMPTEQREFYNRLVAGHFGETEISGSAKLTYLLQTCAGLGTVNGPDISVKLDWLMDWLTTKIPPTEKVVVFSRWLPTIPVLRARLDAAGIGHGTISGPTSGMRDEVRRRFWDDPNMRVCIITTAGERGLNLQIAKYVVLLDLLWNPARIAQILGRVKRSGSPHSTVFLIRLMLLGTVEEGLVRVNRTKQTLADYVNEDESEIWEALSPEERELILRGAWA